MDEANKPAKLSQEEWDRIPPHLKGHAHSELHKCKRIKEHDYGPWGYGEWHKWAEEKERIYKTIKCDCGFYNMIWKEKNEIIK